MIPKRLALSKLPILLVIGLHALLLTLLPKTSNDGEAVASLFEEQCLEAYQIGIWWWVKVAVWGWIDVGIMLGLAWLSAFTQMLIEQNNTRTWIQNTMYVIIKLLPYDEFTVNEIIITFKNRFETKYVFEYICITFIIWVISTIIIRTTQY